MLLKFDARGAVSVYARPLYKEWPISLGLSLVETVDNFTIISLYTLTIVFIISINKFNNEAIKSSLYENKTQCCSMLFKFHTRGALCCCVDL